MLRTPRRRFSTSKGGSDAEGAGGRGGRWSGGRAGDAGDQNAAFCRSVAHFTGYGRHCTYLSRRSQSLEGSRKCLIRKDGSMRSSTFLGYRAIRHIEITLGSWLSKARRSNRSMGRFSRGWMRNDRKGETHLFAM